MRNNKTVVRLPAANEVRKRISMSQPTSNNHIRDRQTGQREQFSIGGGK